jgi:hypothetical protein
MHTLQSHNTIKKRYMAMPQTHHSEGCLTGGQHIGEGIYNYVRDIPF